MTGHSEGVLVKEFCTQRTDKCSPCGNKYADVVKNNTTLAVSFKFPRLVKKKTGPVTLPISQNAHHLLCVAEVTKVMSKDVALQTVLLNTKYCINNSDNMIALPLFGHTVYWYCLSDHPATGGQSLLGSIMSAINPPPFQNLPNHDFDHGRYNTEVESSLNKLKAQIKQAAHSIEPGKLSLALGGLSNKFRGDLATRGLRKGGTHAAWVAANNGNIAGWYEPFSLADNPKERGFPGRLNGNLDRIKKAIKNLLNGS